MLPSGRSRGLLAVALTLVFAAVSAVLLRLLPGPRKHIDYFVIGAIATLAALLALFVVFVSTVDRAHDPLFRRRSKG